MIAARSLPLALALLCAAPLAAPGDPPAPDFSAPTEIDNVWSPFAVDSVMVLRGRVDGQRATSVVRHLPETRVFHWQGQQVETRIVEERDFRSGQLEELALNYLAQDDDGNVWMFGEVSIVYENGEAVGAEDDSWLVGGPDDDEDDPDETWNATAPALYMPAEPQVGQSFSIEPPGIEHPETLTVVKTTKLRVPAGKFTQVLKLREDVAFDGNPPQDLWIAAGVGAIKSRGKGERLQLIATSLVELEDAAAP